MGAVKCAACGEVIVSKHRHDFVVCKCGHSFVDGGNDYLRYGTLTKGPMPEPVVEDGR